MEGNGTYRGRIVPGIFVSRTKNFRKKYGDGTYEYFSSRQPLVVVIYEQGGGLEWFPRAATIQ
jgi:hypothetical protein